MNTYLSFRIDTKLTDFRYWGPEKILDFQDAQGAHTLYNVVNSCRLIVHVILRGYEMKIKQSVKTLSMSLLVVLALAACQVQETSLEPILEQAPIENEAESVEPIAVDASLLGDLEYRCDDLQVTLKDGEFREPAAPDSALENVVQLMDWSVIGDITGDGVDDAAVLFWNNSGGSGTFIYLAVVSGEEGQVTNLSTTLLGDRVQVEALAIDSGKIIVDSVQHGPDDPMCCPSEKVHEIYVLEGDTLVQESREVFSEGEDAVDEALIGPVWQWVRFVDPLEAYDVELAENYTLEFLPDGQVNIQADCNQVLATYTGIESHIDFEFGPSTLAACDEDSLGDEFIKNLDAAAIYFFQDGNLYFDLMMDSGTIHFEPLSAE
jgi:heat shock protein HslJ